MRSAASQLTRSAKQWEEVPASVRLKLSALWVAVMFLYVYVDVFAFYRPGTIDDILIGRVWEFDITHGWALGALALMVVPTLMLLLSVALPAAAARRTNLVVASLYTCSCPSGTLSVKPGRSSGWGRLWR